MFSIKKRKESLAQAIKDQSLTDATLLTMIDFHVQKGNLSQIDGEVLMNQINDIEEEVVEEEIIEEPVVEEVVEEV